MAIFAPLIVKLAGARPPNEQSTKYFDQFGSPSGPGSGKILGVDDLGRDVFSRVLYGARISLEVAFIATFLIVVIGVVMGMVAGYYRGWIDTVLSRSMDVMLAFPVLLLGARARRRLLVRQGLHPGQLPPRGRGVHRLGGRSAP